MKKSKLIDLFGLSGDSSSDDQLDDLLFRLEWERPTTLHGNSKDASFMSAFITTGNTSPESEMVFSIVPIKSMRFLDYEGIHEIRAVFTLF